MSEAPGDGGMMILRLLITRRVMIWTEILRELRMGVRIMQTTMVLAHHHH
jgi:hypothetical protein